MNDVEMDDPDPRLVEVRRGRWAHELADLRLDYAILDAWNAGSTIRDIARTSGLAEHVVTTKVQDLPAKLPPVVLGRAGRRPLEVALRYAVGEIDWDETFRELTTWPYEPEAEIDPRDDGYTFVPGSGSEVWLALSSDLLTEVEYAEIIEGIVEPDDVD